MIQLKIINVHIFSSTIQGFYPPKPSLRSFVSVSSKKLQWIVLPLLVSECWPNRRLAMPRRGWICFSNKLMTCSKIGHRKFTHFSMFLLRTHFFPIPDALCMEYLRLHLAYMEQIGIRKKGCEFPLMTCFSLLGVVYNSLQIGCQTCIILTHRIQVWYTYI